MKKFIFSIAILAMVSFSAAALNHTTRSATVEKREIIRSADSAYLECITLPLNQIPKLSDLHKAATVKLGRWAKLFVVIKMQESGVDGKQSFLARVHNNLTGMRFPKQRSTTAIGVTKTKYSIYKNWYDCMMDFDLFLKHTTNGFTSKFNREPKDEYEMINYIYGSFNPYSTWKRDIFKLLKHYKYK